MGPETGIYLPSTILSTLYPMGPETEIYLSPLNHPVYTVPTGLRIPGRQCSFVSALPRPVWGSLRADLVLSSLKRTHEPFLCPPGLSISSPGRDRHTGEPLGTRVWPTPSPTLSIFKANVSNITCFYNSRANVSTWNHDEGLRATACYSAQPSASKVRGVGRANVMNHRAWRSYHPGILHSGNQTPRTYT